MMSIKLFGILLLCAAVTIDAQEVFGNFQTVDVDDLPSPRELRDLLADIFLTPNTRVQLADALDQLPNILSSQIVDMIPVRLVARNPRITKPSFRKLVDSAVKSIRDNVVSVSVGPEKPAVRPPKPPTPKPKQKPSTKKPVVKPKKPTTPAKPKKPEGLERPGKGGHGHGRGRGRGGKKHRHRHGRKGRKDRKWSDDMEEEDNFEGRRGRRGEGRRGRGERREERRERNPRFRNRFNGLGGGVGAAPLLGAGLGLGGLLF